MDQGDAAETRPGWPRLGLLWVLGIDLRLTILAVPPVLPLIHRDLHLDEKMVAALTGLPVLLFGLAAVPGSLLIARIGARRAAVAGVLLVAVASALRGVGPSVPMLFAMTAAMGAGVAVMQPALPTLVGSWFAGRVPLATAVYANGLLIGEMLSASLTIPLVLPLLGGSWRASFVFWSAPVLATAFLVLGFTPHVEPQRGRARARWWPDWGDIRTWQLGCVLGGGSALYFGCNAFLPDYLHAIGRADLLNAGLTALNTGQIPASFLIMLVGRRLVGRRAPFIVMALVALASLAGLLVPSAPVMIAAAGMIGFAAAFVLILTLALPPLLARSDDVHRLAAGMLALGYSITFIVPWLGGAVWDATHRTDAALLPGVVGVLIIVAMASTFRLERRV
ncbi:MAG TPA: MFS transporter [Acetobacteraceae bacterium]|nr:MFS transporter [Acetobacteraceae bacterium]